MKPYLIALCLLLWTLTPAASKDIVITDDPGGNIEEFIGRFEAIHRRGDRVVIDGFCASACTMSLGYPRTCVTKKAVLGFHQAFYDVLGVRVQSPRGTALVASFYPEPVMRWINAHGGLQVGLLLMGPKTADRLLPHC